MQTFHCDFCNQTLSSFKPWPYQSGICCTFIIQILSSCPNSYCAICCPHIPFLFPTATAKEDAASKEQDAQQNREEPYASSAQKCTKCVIFLFLSEEQKRGNKAYAADDSSSYQVACYCVQAHECSKKATIFIIVIFFIFVFKAGNWKTLPFSLSTQDACLCRIAYCIVLN
ncbi:hypothetical protein FGO68_gene12699 [Halteria grandinella]|uniref:Uncharacterized protein n=1 Tax=Halteria grandinella TaxID=5974 RepID=A0A8J8NK61_HALGN|nr:hypothetical protein FGO68_gene12699 [Halteria grandinella]